MGWGITEQEFKNLQQSQVMTEQDRKQGYRGLILSYGFGEGGAGHSNPVLSGRLAWEYILKKPRRPAWRCEYIDFYRTDDIRLRPGAPARPQGFYYAKFRPGDTSRPATVSQFRKSLARETGCGPEGIQLLTITHPHFQKLMNSRKMPFITLADYDVAPYGFNDFIDAIQLFCSRQTLGLGIGNVDRTYPGFSVPSLRFA